MLKTINTFLVIGFTAVVVNVEATVLKFDDLSVYDSEGYRGVTVADGYGGLNWSNFQVDDGFNPYNEITGFYLGIVSPDNAIFNQYGDPATISSSTPFTLSSGYFTAGYTNGLYVTVSGYLGGNLTRTVNFTVSDTSPTFVNLNLAQITSATFTGTFVSQDNGWHPTHFVIDNLTINEAISDVPEPSTYGLIGIAALGLAFAARRRKLNNPVL